MISPSQREWHISFIRYQTFVWHCLVPAEKLTNATYRRERRPLQGSCRFHIIPTIYWADTWKMKQIQIKTRVWEPKQYLPFYGPTHRGKMTKNGIHLTEQNTLAPSILVIMSWNFTYIIMRHYRKTTNCFCTAMTTDMEPFCSFTPPTAPNLMIL